MKFRVTTSVQSAQGNQVWEVEAKDEAEAKKVFDRGEATFVAEEIEVTSIGEPFIEPA